tara:strand:- start:687 stop:1679 length:993 start_codon:yes stop_codon:yes gene_type:complete
MGNPVSSAVHVNTPLTNVSVAYMQKADLFIAHKVFPQVPVSKQSDIYYTYDKDDFRRSEAQLRAPGTESAGGGYRLDSTNTYFAAVNAIHQDIGDQVRANADAVLNMDKDATEYVTQQLMLKREKDWVSSFFQLGTWTGGIRPSTSGTGDLDGAGADFTQWNSTGATPVFDITRQKNEILKGTGYMPNTLVLHPNVYNALINSDDIVDRVKYTQRGVLGPDLLGAVLGIDRVFVAYAGENTANEGATAANAFIGSNEIALLCYSAPAPSLMHASAGYTFTWSGYTGAQDGMRISRFRMENLRADRVEGELAYDQKLISASLGQVFKNCLA